MCRTRKCQPFRLCQMNASPARVERSARLDWPFTEAGTWPVAQPRAVSSLAGALAEATGAAIAVRATAPAIAIIERFISISRFVSFSIRHPDRTAGL